MRPQPFGHKESHTFQVGDQVITFEAEIDDKATVIKINGHELSGAQMARLAGAFLRSGFISGMPRFIPMEEQDNHPMLAMQFLQGYQQEAFNQFARTVMENVFDDEGKSVGRYVLSWQLIAGSQSAVIIPGQEKMRINGAIPKYELLRKETHNGLTAPHPEVRNIFDKPKG